MAVREQNSSMALRRRGRWGGRILGTLLALQSSLVSGVFAAEFQGVTPPEAAASAAPGVEALRRALKSLRLPKDSASLWVLDLDRDEVLTAEGAEQPRPPASLVKLLPMGAALLSLGPAFRWHTEAWAEGPLRDGVLQGDLLLWGEGDPFFNDEAL